MWREIPTVFGNLREHTVIAAMKLYGNLEKAKIT